MKGSEENLPSHDYPRRSLERRNTTTSSIYSDEKTDTDKKDGVKVHFSPVTDHTQADELDSLPLLSSEFRMKPLGSTPLSLVLNDLGLVLAILFVVVWPWAFLGAVAAQSPGGFEMSASLHKFYLAHEALFAAGIAFLGTTNRFISTTLLGLAVVRYGQEMVAATGVLSVFEVTALMGFRNVRVMWEAGDYRTMLKEKRQMFVVLLLSLAVIGSGVIPAATVVLLTPIPYNTDVRFNGTELDFASGDGECLTWMENNAPYKACQGLTSNGEVYPTCPTEAHMVDMLGAARSNVLPSEPVEEEYYPPPRQIMTGEPVLFRGSTHGVLPIGSDSFLGLKNTTLDELKTVLKDKSIPRKDVYHNYTIVLQGLDTGIQCSRTATSPIQYEEISSGLVSISGNCDPQLGLEPIFPSSTSFTIPNTNNTFAFWACKNAGDSSINLYFNGRGIYAEPIGSITCSLSSFQSKEYRTGFSAYGLRAGDWNANVRQPHSKKGLGSGMDSQAAQHAILTPFVQGVMLEFGNFTSRLQTQSANMVAETLGMLGVKTYDLPHFPARNDIYLKVLEAMVQGVLDYSVTHMRLLYSLTPNRPSSCTRPIKGVLIYRTFGWHAAPCIVKMHLLVAGTLMNLVSLAICIAALVKGRFRYRTNIDPTDTRVLLRARVSGGGGGAKGWGDVVKFE
ncbi:hypothetical protein MD484_g7099, partial [Candolleomyces efflorescens]